MKYTIQSAKYACKNFLYLLPFAILPALFLAISTDQAAIQAVVNDVLDGKIVNWTFSEIFRAISVLNFASWEAIVFGALGIVIIVPCLAMMMAMLEKHMRIGKRTFNGLLGKLNDNLISTCGGVILLLGFYEVWTLIFSAVLLLVAQIKIVAVAYVFAVIVFIGFHLLLALFVSTVYFWVPCMQITGFRAFEALQYSYHLMGEVQWRIIVGQLAVLVVVEGGICFCAMFAPMGLLFTLIATAIFTCLIIIFCVRMQIAYFDRDHIERKDLAKYYHR